ncbi:MAG: hypothetical protein K6C13_15700 [Oscillospiraceae bacterium]|nr:hypothetical protein [Oscillospiraceae bacterium]
MSDTYGIYNGEVHRIGFTEDGRIALYPNSESEKDKTYTDRYNTGTYSKLIAPTELTEAYYLYPYTDYKGHKVEVIRETADEYELYVGDCETAKKLGFDRCDKYGYDLMVRKAGIEICYEKKAYDLNGMICLYEKNLKDGSPEKQTSAKKKYKKKNANIATVIFAIAQIAFLLITAKVVMLIKGVG